MLDDGRREIYIHPTEGLCVDVPDTAVVICYYGTDQNRLSAARKALGLFKSAYKARPGKVQIVESQYERS